MGGGCVHYEASSGGVGRNWIVIGEPPPQPTSKIHESNERPIEPGEQPADVTRSDRPRERTRTEANFCSTAERTCLLCYLIRGERLRVVVDDALDVVETERTDA